MKRTCELSYIYCMKARYKSSSQVRLLPNRYWNDVQNLVRMPSNELWMR